MDDLKSRGRREAAEAIKKAREMGDLSENAEYDAAKDAQGLLEMRIAKLEEIVATSRILEGGQDHDGKAYILSKVKLKNLKNKAVISYLLVAEEEANLREGKLSVKSPVGKALLGREKGDVIDVKIPLRKGESDALPVKSQLGFFQQCDFEPVLTKLERQRGTDHSSTDDDDIMHVLAHEPRFIADRVGFQGY